MQSLLALYNYLTGLAMNRNFFYPYVLLRKDIYFIYSQSFLDIFESFSIQSGHLTLYLTVEDLNKKPPCNPNPSDVGVISMIV